MWSTRPSLGSAKPVGTLLALLIPAFAALAPAATVLAAGPGGEVGKATHAAAAGPVAEAFAPGRLNPAAPPETEQFGRLVGIWDVTMEVLQQDGTWSKPEDAIRAEWRFRYILDGWAVQDDWISPPPDLPVKEGIRQLGTNMRIYDPQEDAWEVAWISNTQQTVSTLTAKAKRKRIVMNGLHPSGKPQRITFYDITDKSFDWTMELQGVGKDPDGWVEIARIHGVKRAATGSNG